MNKSDSIKTIAAALAKAQGNIGAAVKDASNPFFKSHYADLGSVMAVCKAPLLEQGISVLQFVGKDETGGYLETVLLHETGEFISDRMQLVCAKQNDPQAMGSAISYARRYALQSALFIPSVDDDAESAMYRNGSAEVAVKRAAANRQPEVDPSMVVVHVGKSTKDKKVGELTVPQLAYFANEFNPKTDADKALQQAAKACLPKD